MKVPAVLRLRKIRMGLLFLSIFGLIYIILRLLVFEQDPLAPFFRNFFNNWLLIYCNSASFFIDKFNLPYNLEGTRIIFHNHIYDLTTNFLTKKWFFGLLFIIWVFDFRFKDKLWGTLVVFLIHFLFTQLDILLLMSRYSYDYVNNNSAFHVARTPVILAFTSFLSFWILKFRRIIYQTLQRVNINVNFLERKLPDFILLIFIYGFLNNFILGWFDYFSWIQFLFEASSRILDLFGYESQVFKTFLVGANGSIYMEKACLGFSTMALFAAVVYLTSDNTRFWWIYMAIGIVILNIVNIFRFVFLFIHIQKNNGYSLTMDVHDMYNLIIYAVVFIMWVFWFELYALKGDNTNQNLLLFEEKNT